jgi:NAD(P)-dependent dehydrogenase (short-subunit alcohol dehydrogenase family)
MDLGLRDKVVIVAGGASNIGEGIVYEFAREGAKVVILDIDDVKASEVARRAAEITPGAIAYRCDITDLDQVKGRVKEVVDRFSRVDVLVNSVGWEKVALFLEEDPRLWDRKIDLNFRGMLNTTRAVLEYMVKQRGGVIINMGSDAGRVGEVTETVYSGLKAGVMGFSKALAKEVGRYNVRVNVVVPALTFPKDVEKDFSSHSMWMEKEMREYLSPEKLERIKRAYPLGRLGTPEDIAPVVVFLASEKAGFITGQTIPVNGGYSTC